MRPARCRRRRKKRLAARDGAALRASLRFVDALSAKEDAVAEEAACRYSLHRGLSCHRSLSGLLRRDQRTPAARAYDKDSKPEALWLMPARVVRRRCQRFKIASIDRGEAEAYREYVIVALEFHARRHAILLYAYAFAAFLASAEGV